MMKGILFMFSVLMIFPVDSPLILRGDRQVRKTKHKADNKQDTIYLKFLLCIKNKPIKANQTVFCILTESYHISS